eukprot:5939773-Pleurochrysis_carterae.AAC.1
MSKIRQSISITASIGMDACPSRCSAVGAESAQKACKERGMRRCATELEKGNSGNKAGEYAGGMRSREQKLAR